MEDSKVKSLKWLMLTCLHVLRRFIHYIVDVPIYITKQELCRHFVGFADMLIKNPLEMNVPINP